MKRDKIDIFIRVMVGAILAILVATIVVCSIFFRKIDMPVLVTKQSDAYKVYYGLASEYEDMQYTRTKEEYKKIIEDELNLRCYIYIEKNLNIDYQGFMLAGVRVMVIENDLSLSDYCIVFTHEALHFKKFSGNDTYINFETFKFLYENEDAELRNIGITFAMHQLTGRYGGRYDCSSHIVDYFIN